MEVTDLPVVVKRTAVLPGKFSFNFLIAETNPGAATQQTCEQERKSQDHLQARKGSKAKMKRGVS